MSLIEEAAKRLRQLEQTGVQTGHQPARTGYTAEDRPAVPSARAQRPFSAAPVHPQKPADPQRGPELKIDFGRLQASGFLTPAVQDSNLLHEFRVIKRPLIQNALGKTATHAHNSNLIMVTSALPGEGKTFVAMNLAMSIAMEVDCRVLLVDADFVSPSIPGVLGIEPAKGLMDLLTEGGITFRDVLLRTNVERLTLLLAGTPQRGASELLASDAMTRLLGEVAGRYPDRIVVFDSPPLLATTESRVLATHMGQVVVVVEAERTAHAMLESALSTVQSCPQVLTVLNKAQESEAGSYYGAYAHEH
jgi:protein-tyrosine kinase